MKTTHVCIRRVVLATSLGAAFVSSSLPAQDIAAKAEQYLQAATALGRFSGSVLVAKGGRVILSRGYGLANQEWDAPNTPQTKFRIGSVTKSFTAAAILLLQERGRLSVRDPVCKYVDNCPPAWAAVTIHHLLTHTSGIPNYMGFPEYAATMREPTTVDALIARFRDKPLDFPPGDDYRYSNSGYVVLGQIIERLAGMPYAQFLQRNIFTPLGMVNSGYDGPFRILKNRAAGYSVSGDVVINAAIIAMTIPYAAGALFSTTEDLYIWDQVLYSDKLLSRASRDAMFTPGRNDYGYGWGIVQQHQRRAIEHNGQVNGFTSILTRYPDDSVTIVLLTNSDQTVPSVNRVARELAAIVFGLPYEIPRARPVVSVSPQIQETYLGEYEIKPGYVIRIFRTGDRLSAQITGGPPFVMTAESDSTFALEVVDARITFVKAGTTVTHLIMHQGGDTQARKVK